MSKEKPIPPIIKPPVA